MSLVHTWAVKSYNATTYWMAAFGFGFDFIGGGGGGALFPVDESLNGSGAGGLGLYGGGA